MQRSHSFTRLKSWFAPPDRLDLQVARITSGVVMLAGCLVLIGWTLNLAVLTSVIPGAATMKANTAVCFLLAGISLSLQTGKRTRLATQIANGCAIAVSTIGFLTLSEYIFGWNLGIDELLVRDPVATIASNPGRMGINTAIDFCLVGIALWLANRQEPQPSQPQHRVKLDSIAISQSLATVAGFVALQALVGYTNNVQVFYQLSIFTTAMAFQTAIVFVVLCGGMLALRSDRGWMRLLTNDLIGGDVARRFVPIAIVAPLAIGWLILRGHQANFYNTNFAFSLMSISLVAILLGLIGLNAGILNRVDYNRIRSDDRIRLSQEQLQLALEGANQGIWSLDIQTQVVTWDDRCKAIFGLSPAAVVTYAQRLEMLHSDDRQRVVDAVAIASHEGGKFVQEYRTIYPNGTLRWVLSQGRCYDDAAGQPDRILGTMMDITDRKQIEASLRRINRKFSAVFDQTFELLGLLSIEGVVLKVNQTALASVAADKSEIVGKWVWETPWWHTEQLQQQLR
jgi:PAS domain S-box-containing protein